MLIIKPEEASNYYCCSINQPCQGDKCMAWTYHYDRTYEPAEGKTGFEALTHQIKPPKLTPTGKGYCGLTHR